MDKTSHDLFSYLKLLEDQNLVKEHNIGADEKAIAVRYISYNSMDIEQGTLFVCKGSHFSVDYLRSAVEK